MKDIVSRVGFATAVLFLAVATGDAQEQQTRRRWAGELPMFTGAGAEAKSPPTPAATQMSYYWQRVPIGRGFGRPGSPSMHGIALRYS
jgi:hypothetical protein